MNCEFQTAAIIQSTFLQHDDYFLREHFLFEVMRNRSAHSIRSCFFLEKIDTVKSRTLQFLIPTETLRLSLSFFSCDDRPIVGELERQE